MEPPRPQPPGLSAPGPFQRPLRPPFAPPPQAKPGPPAGHSPQSKVAEKHLFRHFGRNRNFIGRRGRASHFGRVTRLHLVGLRGRQAALPAQLWPREAPERHFGILEWDPLFAKF